MFKGIFLFILWMSDPDQGRMGHLTCTEISRWASCGQEQQSQAIAILPVPRGLLVSDHSAAVVIGVSSPIASSRIAAIFQEEAMGELIPIAGAAELNGPHCPSSIGL